MPRTSQRIICALLMVVVLLSFSGAVHGASLTPKAELPLTVTTSLQLDPPNPIAGQPVVAQFAVRNDGATSITLNRIGAGARGPGCGDFTCPNYQDFPLIPSVTIAPGATYTYSEQREFFDAGAYFAQITYEQPATNWHFLGERLDFTVSPGLEIIRPLSLSSTNPPSNELVFAEFELHNASTETIHLERVGVGGRGPDCTPGDWGCASYADYQFTTAVTLAPGENHTFRGWRIYGDPGSYFAQVSIETTPGNWRNLGDRIDLTATAGHFAPRTSPLQFGVQWHPTWITTTDDLELDLAARVGAKVIRIGPSWKRLQPTGRGQWNSTYIAELSRIIDRADAMGIQVILMLLQVPCWASSDQAKNCDADTYDDAYPPIHAADYAAAFAKLVELYGDKVSVWEVWNEPNVERFWKPAPDATAYTQLLKVTYSAIQARQPAAIVLGGSLAGGDMQYLDAMYLAGAKGYFDGVALHPYSSGSPTACNDARWSFTCSIDSAHSMMLHHGDNQKLWLTEFGWSTYAGPGGVSESTQLAYLREALQELDQRDYVAAATWYTLVNTEGATPDDAPHDNDFGLYDRDHRPKQAAVWLEEQARTDKVKLHLPLLTR